MAYVKFTITSFENNYFFLKCLILFCTVKENIYIKLKMVVAGNLEPNLWQYKTAKAYSSRRVAKHKENVFHYVYISLKKIQWDIVLFGC